MMGKELTGAIILTTMFENPPKGTPLDELDPELPPKTTGEEAAAYVDTLKGKGFEEAPVGMEALIEGTVSEIMEQYGISESHALAERAFIEEKLKDLKEGFRTEEDPEGKRFDAHLDATLAAIAAVANKKASM